MSVRTLIRASVRRAWKCTPVESGISFVQAVIRQAPPAVQRLICTPALLPSLSLLKENGFDPTLVVDVGANVGSWSLDAHRIFSKARFRLLDADPLNAARLQQTCAKLPNSEFSISLLGAEPREEVVFYQMGTGSSVLLERTPFDRTCVTIPMTTLDSVVSVDCEGSVLLKLDVQGYEIEVLRGAKNLLSKAEVVILECSLIEYNEGAPLFAEVVSFMGENGFSTYDFCGLMRRKSDGALFQVDVVFVRHDSPLRKPFEKWTPAK